MSNWEKVDFGKSMRNYVGDPMVTVSRHYYEDKRKNTYKVSFNVLGTKLLEEKLSGYDGKIFVDIVSGNAGVKIGIVKGVTFECKYRYNRKMLEISSKKLVDYLIERYGDNPMFKLVPVDGGVIELNLVKGGGENGGDR